MTPHPFSRAGLTALAAGALVSLSPKLGHAQQFTLFDVTFDFTWEDAINSSPSKSHYYVKSDKLNAQRPTNWIAPIDYRTGKVHVLLEVLEKPAGGQKQGWALCYVGGGSYGCPYTKYYTEKGVYENEVDMTAFYNNATIDWTKGITEVDLVYTINDSGSGHVHFFPDLKELTTPTKVRIAMVQVAKGSTYDPSTLPSTGGNLGGAGGMAGTGGAAGTNGGAGSPAGGGTGGPAGSAATAGNGGVPPSTAGTTSQPAEGGATGASAGAGSGGAPGAAGTTSSGLAPRGANDDAGCSLAGATTPSPHSRAAWLAGFALFLRSRRRRNVT
jgi:MYXO-CTERM domain-containing protein